MDDRWQPVLEELRARFAADTDAVEVERWLSSQGYDRRQIGEILSLLFRDPCRTECGWVSSGPADLSSRPTPIRVQGPHERGRFTPEAWGYLLTLHASGVVPPNDFEQLVERALLHVDGRIALTELRVVADDLGVDDGATSGVPPLLH